MSLSPQYVAGFLDGEGHITISEANRYKKQWSYRLIVGFTNRDVRPLLAIQEIYGGTIHAKARRSLRHSAAFELHIHKRADTGRILTDVLPHLLIKREQAELGLAFLALGRVKMVLVGRRQIHPTKGGSHPILNAAPGEREVRANMKANLSILNQRGAA